MYYITNTLPPYQYPVHSPSTQLKAPTQILTSQLCMIRSTAQELVSNPIKNAFPKIIPAYQIHMHVAFANSSRIPRLLLKTPQWVYMYRSVPRREYAEKHAPQLLGPALVSLVRLLECTTKLKRSSSINSKMILAPVDIASQFHSPKMALQTSTKMTKIKIRNLARFLRESHNSTFAFILFTHLGSRNAFSGFEISFAAIALEIFKTFPSFREVLRC